MELISAWPSWQVLLGLLALMMGANEVGYRFGALRRQSESESARSVSNALKASVFGLVALLLGFSFSMTTNRHEDRRRVVLDEANGIGTCYLRAGLLADPERTQLRDALRKYVDLRLELFEKALDLNERARILSGMDREIAEVWAAVEASVLKHREMAHTSQIVPAANAVIDLHSTRLWVARSHLPTPVFVLLLVCVVVTSLLMGHSSGQTGTRHVGLWASLNVLLLLLLFIILDFDRPRQGFIRVDHSSLVELQAGIQVPNK